MEDQGRDRRAVHAPNDNFRPSFDADAPVDAHARPKVDYLTENEVMKLVAGARASRNAERDQLPIFMLFRHGYRESELIMTRRNWIDLQKAVIWIERLKRGMSRYHPLAGDELRRMRKYLRSREDDLPWLFVSERCQPLSPRSVRRIVADAAKTANLQHVHPHMLRHSCGFHLRERGHDIRMIQEYLGHASITSTQL
ncbi:MAG: tyrosine-type recombinase/integrase [Pseudomonadota bacterium]